MIAPARALLEDSKLIDHPSGNESEAGAYSFTPIPLRVESLIEKPNRKSVITTQEEDRKSASDEVDIERHNGSSAAVDIILGRYMPRPLFVLQAREFFRAMQKWEGYVLEVSSDTFRARLAPLCGEGTDQEAEIYLEEIDPDDRALMKPGAVFYWSIGYLDRPSGRIRASILRFRRLPGWTKGELARSEAEVERLRALFAEE